MRPRFGRPRDHEELRILLGAVVLLALVWSDRGLYCAGWQRMLERRAGLRREKQEQQASAS